MNPRQVNKWLVTASVMIPTLIELVDTTVVNVSLTHIQGTLSAGREEVSWILTSYLVSNAIVIPMSAWLAGIFGRKRYLIASIVVFTISSLLCGLASSLTGLIVFRVVQGIGGGGLQPMAMAILMETFPPKERGLAMAVYGMGIVLGPVLGPLLGGYLTDNYSWRWIFYINLPTGILAVFMCLNFIFDRPAPSATRRSGFRIDYAGLALLCLGIGCLQIVLDKGQLEDWFSSDYIIILTVVSGVSLLSLIVRELKFPHPILNLRIFKDVSFATGNVLVYFGFFAFYGALVLLPLFLQELLGYTALQAGLVLGPSAGLAVVAMLLVGRLIQRFDPRILLIIGLLIAAYSLYYMSGFNLYIDFRTAALGRVMQGAGIPFFFVSISTITMAFVPANQLNQGSAIFNLLRNLGASCGVAFATTLLARRTQFHQNRLIDHLSLYDFGVNLRLSELEQALKAKLGGLGDIGKKAGAIIYNQIQSQAASLAFNDAFFLQMLIFLGMIGLVLLVRKPPTHGRPTMVE